MEEIDTVRLRIKKSELHEYLAKALSSKENVKVNIKNFSIQPITPRPCRYITLLLSNIQGSTGGINGKEGTLNQYPDMVCRIYRKKPEGDIYPWEEPMEKFKIERYMLDVMKDVKFVTQRKKLIRAYPDCYSHEISDCTRNHIIIREYIKEPSFLGMALTNSVSDETLQEMLYPTALLHAITDSKTKNASIGPYLNPISDEDIGDRLAKGMQILTESQAKTLDPLLLKKIKACCSALSMEICSENMLKSLINDNLDLNSRTASAYLDAGSTRIGSSVYDVAVALDPVLEGNFSGDQDIIKRRAGVIARRYLNLRRNIEEVLKEPLSYGVDPNKFAESLYFAGFYRAIHHAATIVSRESKHIHLLDNPESDRVKNNITLRVNRYLLYARSLMHLMRQTHPDSFADVYGDILRTQLFSTEYDLVKSVGSSALELIIEE